MEKYAMNVISGVSADAQLSGDLCPGLLLLLHLALWLELDANKAPSASVCVCMCELSFKSEKCCPLA